MDSLARNTILYRRISSSIAHAILSAPSSGRHCDQNECPYASVVVEIRHGLVSAQNASINVIKHDYKRGGNRQTNPSHPENEPSVDICSIDICSIDICRIVDVVIT